MNKESEIANIIDGLAERWQEADKAILREVFPILASGTAVSVNQLMEITTAGRSIIESALRQGRAGFDGKGDVHELYGVDLNPSRHRAEVDGVALFTCCALVAQMLPFILDESIQLESIDPLTRRIVRLSISPETEIFYEPKNSVATLVRVEQSLLTGDIASLFCDHVNFFASMQSADQFVSQHPGRFIVGMDEIRETGKQLYAKVWA